MNFKLHVLRALKDNFIYAFLNGDECAVMDPGEATVVEDFLREHSLKLTRILLTHHHLDHVGGVPELVLKWKPEVWCSEFDQKRIPGASLAVKGEVELYGEKIRLLPMKGHTQGQIVYYFANRKMIFVGDTLFSAGCGRLLEGTPEQMHESLKVLAALPPETKVYFGHEYTLRNLAFVLQHEAVPRADAEKYLQETENKLARFEPSTPTTIGAELKVNPFLRAKSLTEFIHWRELRNSF